MAHQQARPHLLVISLSMSVKLKAWFGIVPGGFLSRRGGTVSREGVRGTDFDGLVCARLDSSAADLRLLCTCWLPRLFQSLPLHVLNRRVIWPCIVIERDSRTRIPLYRRRLSRPHVHADSDKLYVSKKYLVDSERWQGTEAKFGVVKLGSRKYTLTAQPHGYGMNLA